MKKIILCFTLLASTLIYSQNRQDDALPIISKETKGQILNAIGWKKNQYGKWVSAKNKIPYDIEQEFKSLANIEIYSLGDNKQNFISYQLRDVKIKDSTYSLLIEKYKDGYYQYESIQQGWRFASSYKFYIFKKKELDRFRSINDDSIHTIDIDILYNDNRPFVDLTKLTTTVIAKDINSVIKESSPYNQNKLFITLRRFRNKKIVQFFISTNFYDFNENMYYETDELTFNNLLKLQ